MFIACYIAIFNNIYVRDLVLIIWSDFVVDYNILMV